MTNLVTLRVDVVCTEVTWDAFGLLGFLKTFGFAPSQRLVLSKYVE